MQRTIFFTPIIVKYMKRNLDMTKPVIKNKFCQSLGPSLYPGSTVYGYPLFILRLVFWLSPVPSLDTDNTRQISLKH